MLEVKGHHWLTGGRLTRYQTLLMDALNIILEICQILNPATLLPVVKSGDLLHQCMHTCSVLSDSLQPHGLQPKRLLCPWNSPGKNSGVGSHFLLQCLKLKSESEVAQSMSDSLRPQGLQPTRLLRPCDFPGKSTGLGCHCLLRVPKF